MLRFIVRQRVDGRMVEQWDGVYDAPVPALRRADSTFKGGSPCVDVLVVDADGFSDRIYLRRNDSALTQLTLVGEVA